MAFLSLTACGGGGSSETAGEIEVSLEESFEELVSVIADEDDEAEEEEEDVESASLEISWDDLADNEDGFLIERSLGDSDEFDIVTSVDADETSYVDNNISVDSTYCYRIGAFNESGIAYSDVSCTEEI